MRKGSIENLLRKGFIENYKSIFKIKILSPNPIRRDQPGQRLRVNGCGPTVDRKLFSNGMDKYRDF
ncbi:hypothetical protein [Methanosarcina spelaei]|uniref:hypothetical protein n=1 Tax=Methanosarcina spelaei TaxID=1036679 RepID=UPI001482A9DC|nr:hypothetical protein [Methanosarcina spelaei]